MATRTQTIVSSDLSGFSDAHTVRFSLGISQYEIDLTDAEDAVLHGLLEEYVARGRKVQPAGGRAFHGNRAPRAGDDNSAEVRAWAREHGYSVMLRGRIPQGIREAYAAAHPAG